MSESPKEVSPYGIIKRAGASENPGDETPVPEEELESAREVYPVMFTRPGEDVFGSDERSAVFSDFRAIIEDADDDTDGDSEDTSPNPKDLYALESATSSIQSITETDEQQETTAPPEPVTEEDAAKDSGKSKENENSSQTSSLRKSPGKNKPPA